MPAGVDFNVRPLLISDSLRSSGLGPLRFRGAIALQSRSESFGAYSGLHVSDDGTELVAIGWGGWLGGRLSYGSTGDLTGIEVKGEYPILDVSGQPITKEAEQDAEGLVYSAGYYYVGFETNSRVARYAGIDAAAEPVDISPGDLATIPDCCGFSSVAVTARNELLALTEAAHDSAGNVKGWIWTDGGREPLWLRGARDWLPVDMTLLPDGDLLLVEVRQGDSDVWRSRFSRIAKADVRGGAVMQPIPLGELHSVAHPDRIEGIHARRGSSGEVLVYAISDSRRGWPTNILLFELVER